MATKGAEKSLGLVEAVQLVFDALQPFDEAARQRILSSAVSLLGGTLPTTTASGGTASRALTHTAPPQPERPLSPIELIQQKQPGTNPQRIALFAYYREKYEGLSRFSKDDLRGYFTKAKEPPPGNYDRDYALAARAGWIYDDGAADSYLTSKGLEAVEAGFGGKRLSPGASKGKGKEKKRNSARTKKKI